MEENFSDKYNEIILFILRFDREGTADMNNQMVPEHHLNNCG